MDGLVFVVDVVGFVLVVFEEGEVQLEVIAVVERLAVQFAGAERFEEVGAIDGCGLLVLLALRLVTGALLDQYFLHPLEPLHEDGLGPGEYHQRVLEPQQNRIAVELYNSECVPASKLMRS